MLEEVTAPDPGALPVAALRDHLRLGSGFEAAEDPAETAALAGYLRAAIAIIEARIGKALLARQFRLRLSRWRDPEGETLPLAPILAIERIEIEDGAGGVRLLDPASYRLLPDLHRPALLPLGTLLPAIPGGGSAVITFSAGFGAAWAQLPADVAQAVLFLAARYHEDRTFEGSEAAIPFGVSAMIERWRLVRVLGGRGNLRARA